MIDASFGQTFCTCSEILSRFFFVMLQVETCCRITLPYLHDAIRIKCHNADAETSLLIFLLVCCAQRQLSELRSSPLIMNHLARWQLSSVMIHLGEVKKKTISYPFFYICLNRIYAHDHF